MVVNTPSQILKCHPRGFVEIIRILSLDHGVQRLACVETVFRQKDGTLVVNYFVLVRSSMSIHRWTQNEHQPEPEPG